MRGLPVLPVPGQGPSRSGRKADRPPAPPAFPILRVHQKALALPMEHDAIVQRYRALFIKKECYEYCSQFRTFIR